MVKPVKPKKPDHKRKHASEHKPNKPAKDHPWRKGTKEGLPVVGPMGCNTPCNRCLGIKRVMGCPLGETKGSTEELVLLWPPNPKEDSWFSDVANEGIGWDGDGLFSTGADYHGYYLTEPGTRKFEAPYFKDHGKKGTDSEQYGIAYKALEKSIKQSPEKPLGAILLDTLLPLGWRVVRGCDRPVQGTYGRYPLTQYTEVAPCFPPAIS